MIENLVYIMCNVHVQIQQTLYIVPMQFQC